MKNILLVSAGMLAGCASAQNHNHFNQYSIEIAAGLNHSAQPQLTGLRHFEGGFRYMHTEYWGIKADYGFDGYKTPYGAGKVTQVNRISAQVIYNLGRKLRISDVAPNVFNFLLHGGAGLTLLRNNEGNYDKGTNVLIGGTAQFYLSPQFALTGDLTGMLNFKQNYRYDSTGRYGYFTGTTAALSVGITYYFGRNGATADWH